MEIKDKYQSFSFIKKVAFDVYNKLIENQYNEEMLDSIRNQYQETEEYPSNTFDLLIQRITDKDILDNLENIYKYNKDNMENLYNYIFLPEGEEEEEEEEWEDKIKCDTPSILVDQIYLEDHSDDNCNNNQDDNGDDNSDKKLNLAKFYTQESLRDRIQKQIDQITSKLPISKNLAYLLLKKFNRNEEIIISKWYNKIEIILNMLGELRVPEILIKDDLLVKKIGYGECPLCVESDVELYQLYCSHFLCFNCWKGEIEAQLENIKLKVTPIQCRLDGCGSEIMISDVKLFCGENKAKLYEDSMIQQQTFNDKKLIKCPAPNCPYFISIESLVSGSVAKCECGKQVCWHCHEDAHSPLKCGKLDEWKNLKFSMEQVLREQREWIEREKELAVYRFHHVDEVKNVYNQYNDRLLREHQAANEKEIIEIQNLEEKMKKVKDGDPYQRFLIQTIDQKQIDHEKKVKEREEVRHSIIEDQKMHIKKINKFLTYAYEDNRSGLKIGEIKSNLILRKERIINCINNSRDELARAGYEMTRVRREKSEIESELVKITENDPDDVETITKITEKIQSLDSHLNDLQHLRENLINRIREFEMNQKMEKLERIPLEIESLEREISDNEIDDDERERLISERNALQREREILQRERERLQREFNVDGREREQREEDYAERRNRAFNQHNDMLKRIKKYDNDDSGFKTNEEFIAAKTRKCPNCGVIIQKNGGCNHIKCTRCLYQFCWLCGKEWKGLHKPCPQYGPMNGLPEEKSISNASNDISSENANNNNHDENANNNNHDENANNNNHDENANNNNHDENANNNNHDENANNNNHDENANNNNHDENANNNNHDENANNNNHDENTNNNNHDENANNNNHDENANNTNHDENANDEDRSFRLPPINYIFSKKYNMWMEYFHDYNRILCECERERNGSYASSRKEAYERAKHIFLLEEVDKRFAEIIQTYDNARNVLLHSYAAAFFMDHESEAFVTFKRHLEALNKIYFELARILISCKSNEPFRPIIEISRRTNLIVNEILNEFDL